MMKKKLEIVVPLIADIRGLFPGKGLVTCPKCHERVTTLYNWDGRTRPMCEKCFGEP